MTGLTLTGLINNVFTEHYIELRKFAHNEDHLHQSYINVMERIERGVIKTGNTITEATKGIVDYFKKTIVNCRKAEWKQEKKYRKEKLEDGYLQQAEDELRVMEELELDDMVMQGQVNTTMKAMWEYLDKYHNQYEIYIFKVYYFSGRKLTYNDISRLHNIKPWAIDKILKGLRKSLRENLIHYMEDQEKFERVAEYIEAGRGIPREKFHVALDLFKDVYPEHVKTLCMGCRGKSIKIMWAHFLTYYKLNKHKYESTTDK
jgi:hypothetical protein